MVATANILGWIGLFLFLCIVFNYKKMVKHNEYALLHTIFFFMYALWLPLPFALYVLVEQPILQIGTVFGLGYLIMILVTMALQTGHITYLVKNDKEEAFTNEQGAYMMATLSHPFEILANVLKFLWIIFLGIAFWMAHDMVMFGLMVIFSLVHVYYVFMLLDTVLVKSYKLFSWAKPNVFITNFETALFIATLLIYSAIQ